MKRSFGIITWNYNLVVSREFIYWLFYYALNWINGLIDFRVFILYIYMYIYSILVKLYFLSWKLTSYTLVKLYLIFSGMYVLYFWEVCILYFGLCLRVGIIRLRIDSLYFNYLYFGFWMPYVGTWDPLGNFIDIFVYWVLILSLGICGFSRLGKWVFGTQLWFGVLYYWFVVSESQRGWYPSPYSHVALEIPACGECSWLLYFTTRGVGNCGVWGMFVVTIFHYTLEYYGVW